jgi:tetratricopeptide (TPR) repeat protein
MQQLIRFLFHCVLGVAVLLSGCHRASMQIEPQLIVPLHPKEVQREKRFHCEWPSAFSVSPFCPLTAEELCEDWGKELRIGLEFAKDFDLYRAITCFKRALFLLPQEACKRSLEIHYDLVLAYYLGKKYTEAVYQFETSQLVHADPSFPAYEDLLLILYDSYLTLGCIVRAECIYQRIEKELPHVADRLNLLSALQSADFEYLYEEAATNPCRRYLEPMLLSYEAQIKSVRRAEYLNAVLPGAGYWYIGQKQTAITAFLVNSLFIGATYLFFDHGNTPAALITLSLESGWYFGGVYGAGLAAKAYNERLFESYAQKITQKECLFPLMMLKFSF